MIRWTLLLILAAGAWGAPCTRAAPECAEKVPLGPAGRFSLVYRSYPLGTQNAAIERALIVIHGAGRNADHYFASGVAGALLAEGLETTLVASPRFASGAGNCRDKLDAGEISWGCSGPGDWRGGGAAPGLAGVHSYDLIDELLKILARREVFPNLKVIVITGHSAGGQFLNRYAAANRVETGLGVPVRHVVSNPSSYLYLDETRLTPGAACTEKGDCTGGFSVYREGQNCTTYNQWRYGMEKRVGYAAALPDAGLRSQLAARDVTYLLGGLDTLPLFGFDGSCPAMAQGPNRLARGLTYWNYLKSKHGARHNLVIVPNCGHNGRCMYTADPALPLLFPR